MSHPTVLEEICQKKILHVKERKAKLPLEELLPKIQEAPVPKGFIKSIQSQKGKPAIIAEVKKASPSKGVIREDFDPLKIAQIYSDNGASCLSVLTDEPYFHGHDDYLYRIARNVSTPALRKDFMVDPYQIYEARALGADCILLIMAALKDDYAADLYELATDLGMDVLVEIHDEEELKRAEKLKPAMIGVNNRNLKTLAVDIQTSYNLLELIPSDAIKVAESGISEAATISELHAKGYDAFLIGESLMRQDDIALALKTLLATV